MNPVHWHLVLNHLPLAGVAFGAALLLWGLRRRQGDVQRAALGALIVTAGLAAISFWTGGRAEEMLERLPGWSEDLIELHEKAAAAALWATLALGAASAWALRAGRGAAAPPEKATNLVLTLAVACLLLLGWASYKGGQIRHSEIQPELVR